MKFKSASRLRPAVVAAAALLSLAAAGCARSEPGVVAYVGDEEITQTAVDRAVTGLSSTLEAGQRVSSEAVVNAMIQGAVAEQIATEQKIPLTDAERNTVVKGSELEPLLGVPDAKPVVYDLADQAIVSDKLGAEAYLAQVEQRSVTLNPRYGVLDPKTKTILTDQSGSLSTPAPLIPSTP